MANSIAILDSTFHALADPTRRAVIGRLTDGGAATVKELAAPFAIGLPTFLKHLRVLEASGLISTEKSGRVRTCRIHRTRLAEAEQWLSRRRRLCEERLDRFAAYVEAMERNQERR